MSDAPPRALGELAEIEAIIRRHVWARYVAACDEPQVLGIGAAAAEIAALRAPQGDGGGAMKPHDYEVVGKTYDGVKVLRPISEPTHFTREEIRSAVKSALDQHSLTKNEGGGDHDLDR